MSVFYIKEGDTSPAIQGTCQLPDGTAADLSGGTVRFHMRKRGVSTVVVDAPATIISGPSGSVRYDWEVADTVESGDFICEWEVTYADGSVESFPNFGYQDIKIYKEII